MDNDSIPLAVYVLPPSNGGTTLYRRALKTFRGLNATVLARDAEMSDWAAAQADQILAHVENRSRSGRLIPRR
jgi:hypothetical protein